MTIFSSAVFGENPRYCYSLCSLRRLRHHRRRWRSPRRREKTLTCCNISVITEDIDSEHVFTVQRAIYTTKGDDSKWIFFFQNYSRFST